MAEDDALDSDGFDARAADTTEPAAPEPGGFDRRSEVSALLDVDETAAGDVWRGLRAGKTPQQVADEYGITVGPVYSFINLHNALLDGTVSSAPTVARGVAGRVRKWLKTKPLSERLRRALEEQEQLLNAVVNDSQASEAESEQAVEKSKAAEAENITGIYVYTLPHYVRYPYDRKTGRTLLKVGHSSVDALYRANSQTRVTSLPEDPCAVAVSILPRRPHTRRGSSMDFCATLTMMAFAEAERVLNGS